MYIIVPEAVLNDPKNNKTIKNCEPKKKPQLKC